MTRTTVTSSAQQATRPGARRRRGVGAALAAAIGRRQTALSDRVHARGDVLAACDGWEISAGTGRFGFGNRTYHDPRFAARRPATADEDHPSPTELRPFSELTVPVSRATPGPGGLACRDDPFMI